MKIAQVSPLFESVPPQMYGGTERVVSYLTEELVKQGHDVTLFASGDSVTTAKLIPCSPRSLRLDESCIDQLAHQVVMLERVAREAHSFDIVHFHIDYTHFPMSRRGRYPHVTTLHGRLDIADLVPVYQEFPDMPVVSISNDQRRPRSWVNWQDTVYHGLPADLYKLHTGPGKYLAFVGRISPEKRVDRAIEIAVRAGLPLKIAAKVDKVDQAYFDEVIEPMLSHPLVEHIGEIGDEEKDDFLGNATASLFPIDWPEPFGLTMIEAMACGTPVIAYPCGSVPEIIEHGVNGFICNSIEEAVEAVERIDTLSRERCRQMFEERFTAERMAHDYVKIYERLVRTIGRLDRVMETTTAVHVPSTPAAPSLALRPQGLSASAAALGNGHHGTSTE